MKFFYKRKMKKVQMTRKSFFSRKIKKNEKVSAAAAASVFVFGTNIVSFN